MPVDLELVPKQKRPAGEPCCEPVVYPDVERDRAIRMAEVAKALGDPIRLQLVDVLRKHAGKVCVCELVPLFAVSQPTLSHHLKRLRDAGIVDSERRGLWAYYYVLPEALQELTRLAIFRQTGSPSRLLLDVGGYRETRRKELVAIAKNAAERVKQYGEPVRLEAMNAFERKCVHDVVNAIPGVQSESEGVEPSRRIVVRVAD